MNQQALVAAQSIKVQNVTEELVEQFMTSCMQSLGMCTCPICQADVKAYALNHLPPQYAVSVSGKAFLRAASMSTQSEADIIAAIMQAAILVKDSPHHDREE